jgi:MFS family permease
MLGLPFCPETPRWLVEKGYLDRARKSLDYLREGSYSNEEVEAEFAHIAESVEEYKSMDTRWSALFTKRDLFDRLWRAALLQFMAQMCGATAMKYYLPTLFSKLGIEHRLTLLISGIESTLKIGCTIIEMFLIDRFGRRITLLFGCTVMTIAMLVRQSAPVSHRSSALTKTHHQINGALPLAYPKNLNHASDYACIVFIFFFTFGYSVGFGPASWVYGSEVRYTCIYTPKRVRS